MFLYLKSFFSIHTAFVSSVYFFLYRPTHVHGIKYKRCKHSHHVTKNTYTYTYIFHIHYTLRKLHRHEGIIRKGWSSNHILLTIVKMNRKSYYKIKEYNVYNRYFVHVTKYPSYSLFQSCAEVKVHTCHGMKSQGFRWHLCDCKSSFIYCAQWAIQACCQLIYSQTCPVGDISREQEKPEKKQNPVHG